MKHILKVILLVAVFLIVAEVLELIIEAVSGTPNHGIQRQLSALQNAAEVCQWLGSKEGKSVMEGTFAIRFLAILPIASFVTGLVGGLLRVTRKKVIVLVSITCLCIVALSSLATLALYEMLETIQCVGARTSASCGHVSLLVVVLLITGFGLSCFAAWLGQLLGTSRITVIDS